jgi:enoyl-CoA hydratase/carnithine racemase
LRLAEADIKLGMPPAKLGLVYSHTGLRRFIDAIGAARTRELFLLGEYIDAATALDWGLVNRVAAAAALEAVALELAGQLAGNAPLAQRGNKRVIAALLAAEGELPEEVEEELIELRRASFASQDMREGMRAFADKRPPRWRGE